MLQNLERLKDGEMNGLSQYVFETYHICGI